MTRAVPLCALLLGLPACGGGADPPRGRTVVLISLDTLSPGRLGVYGGDPAVSPHIDALAREAVVFDQALAPAPWTLPSHMTMLTGLDPVAHGVRGSRTPLSPDVTTLAEVLRDAGFDTAAFTDGGYVAARYGFDQGFDAYDDVRNAPGKGPNGFARLMPGALRWLRARGDRDAFLFLHTFDAHAPYDEGDPEVLERFRQRPVEAGPLDHELGRMRFIDQQNRMKVTDYHRLDQLLNDYDAGVHEGDRGVGEVLAVLRETGRWANALVLVTSDHGEAFLERGLHVGHGIALTDNEIRVPLVVRFPDGLGAGTRVDAVVGLVDLARTVLDTWGIEGPEETQGASLRPVVRGEPRGVETLLGSSRNISSYFLVEGDYKYVTLGGTTVEHVAKAHLGPRTPEGLAAPAREVEYERNGVSLAYDFEGDPLGIADVVPLREQLYDRRTDPEERENLSRDPAHAALLERMRSAFAQRFAHSEELRGRFHAESDAADAPSAPSALSKGEQMVLAALGYLGDDSELEVDPRARKRMRKRIREMPPPPDTSALVEQDRRVHAVRARVLDGEALGAADRRTLEEAAQAYRDWMRENPGLHARAGWRLRGVWELLTATGHEEPLEEWLKGIGGGPR